MHAHEPPTTEGVEEEAEFHQNPMLGFVEKPLRESSTSATVSKGMPVQSKDSPIKEKPQPKPTKPTKPRTSQAVREAPKKEEPKGPPKVMTIGTRGKPTSKPQQFASVNKQPQQNVGSTRKKQPQQVEPKESPKSVRSKPRESPKSVRSKPRESPKSVRSKQQPVTKKNTAGRLKFKPEKENEPPTTKVETMKRAARPIPKNDDRPTQRGSYNRAKPKPVNDIFT